jgi:CheY-like chemotaxis protein
MKLVTLVLCVGTVGWWVMSHRLAIQAREQEAAKSASSSTAESPYAKLMPKRPGEQVVVAQVAGPSILADPLNRGIVVILFALGTVLGMGKLASLSGLSLEVSLGHGNATFRLGARRGREARTEFDGDSEVEAALRGRAGDKTNVSGTESEADEKLEPNEYADGLAKHGPEHIAAMSDRLLDLEAEPTTAAREEVFEHVFVGLRSVAQAAQRAGANELLRLTRTAEQLVTKVVEQPTLATESVYQSLLGGLSLMGELCVLKPGASGLGAPIRVLAVDDNLICQRTLATALEPCVDAFDVAGNGKVAIQKAEGQDYDVIFMDVLMPQIDGFDACAKIREGRNRATPVVFVTSKGDREAIRKARASGGNGFIAKPILPAEIALVALTATWRSRLAAITGGTQQGQNDAETEVPKAEVAKPSGNKRKRKRLQASRAN